jgi:hypothetical protein
MSGPSGGPHGGKALSEGFLGTAAPRYAEAARKRIGVRFNCFLPHECQAYLENAEYGSP